MTMTDGIDQETADVIPAAPKSLVRSQKETKPNPLPMAAACALEELVSAAAEELKREASLSATVCKPRHACIEDETAGKIRWGYGT